MGPLSVVDVDVLGDVFGLEAVLQFMQIYCLLLQGPPQLFDHCPAGVYMQTLKGIEILTSASFKVAIHAGAVNWEP